MPRTKFPQVLNRLRQLGLLLQQDKVLENVVVVQTGERLAGSWWSHPQAHTIFDCLSLLAGHPDVLTTKLVSGKVTFVHRRLWPALLSVATAREPWQFLGLSGEALRLYGRVEQQGELLAFGPAAKEIERRLLVQSQQVHTEAGHHEICLKSWATWARHTGFQIDMPVNEGQAQIEAAVRALGGRGGELPWESNRGKS